jgi:hypothetical protein
MTAKPLERSSAAKAGWVFVAIFAGWLLFVFVPAPKPDVKPTEKSPARPVSKLRLVGLPDNPDLEGLPEFFAVWADKAEWKDNRTVFAYWNPGTKDYTYFFQAVRRGREVRFHEIAKPDGFVFAHEPNGPAPDEHPLEFPSRLEEVQGPDGSVPIFRGPKETPSGLPPMPVDVPNPRLKPAAPILKDVQNGGEVPRK